MSYNEISISDYKYEHRMTKLADYFDATLTNDCEEYSIRFNNKRGHGRISGINLDHGMNIMTFDFTPLSNLKFKFNLGRRHPILFLYTRSGVVDLTENVQSSAYHTTDNETIIFAPKGDSIYSIQLKANEPVQFIFVGIVRFLFLGKVACDIDTIPEPLENMFRDTTGSSSFYFKSAGSTKSMEAVELMFNTLSTGLERKIKMEANALSLIISMIKRFRVEQRRELNHFSFTRKDIEALNKAKKYILDNLDITPDVREISNHVGLNANKIQKGFHLLFYKSLRQFIISAKMHKAKMLLDEGEYTISEVSYSINYTNKGHFSQLFKKEFGLLPSEYTSKSY